MEPSWTSPILQALQQHRGSQLHKPAPATPVEAARVPANAAKPDQGGRSDMAAEDENFSKA